MATIRKDEYGRLFEEGMIVLNYYPYSLNMREDGLKDNKLPKRQKVDKIKDFPNKARFVCVIESSPGDPTSYDPAFLEPIEYVTKNIEIIYGKK